MQEIILPELGEGIAKATVACWHYNTGDKIQEGDDVVEVVTDKASFNIPSPSTGRLQAIQVAKGEDACVGGVLGLIG